MQGKRHDIVIDFLELDPGEYGKTPEGVWYCRPPETNMYGVLSKHEVFEHEDGTITVSPSILITHWRDGQWHGYLERGVWRKV